MAGHAVDLIAGELQLVYGQGGGLDPTLTQDGDRQPSVLIGLEQSECSRLITVARAVRARVFHPWLNGLDAHRLVLVDSAHTRRV